MAVVYGYAKAYEYAGDGTLKVQVRIPSIHGPYKQGDVTAYGTTWKQTYVLDEDLPWYDSVLLKHLPNDGEVVALMNVGSSVSSDFLVIGLTGGSYSNGATTVGY